MKELNRLFVVWGHSSSSGRRLCRLLAVSRQGGNGKPNLGSSKAPIIIHFSSSPSLNLFNLFFICSSLIISKSRTSLPLSTSSSSFFYSSFISFLPSTLIFSNFSSFFFIFLPSWTLLLSLFLTFSLPLLLFFQPLLLWSQKLWVHAQLQTESKLQIYIFCSAFLKPLLISDTLSRTVWSSCELWLKLRAPLGLSAQ